ncbi:MAG: hypothetical protein WC197_01055 [Candidatus Gastranaerophilaceae bacterium]|jgi:hypothetical protein
MSNEFKGLVIAIPTRNRAEMAINAIKSVFAYSESNVKLVISDNSTDEKEIELLSRFCSNLNNSRLNYIKPPESLAMPKHWDWIANYLLENYDETHFAYLPDRVVFKKGAINDLIEAIKIYPDEIISYNTDIVWDCEKPIKAYPENKPYKLTRITAEELICAIADNIEAPRALPRMLNNVAPRSILNELKSKYGNIFISLSPDYSFAFRILENYGSIIYCEKSLIINYGFNRSNGINFAKNNFKDDAADFLKNLDKKNDNILFLAPIPELLTFYNGIIHEYYLVKNESGSQKFKDINREKYLKRLEEETRKFININDRKKAVKVLIANGAKTKGEFYYFYKEFRKIFNIRKNFIAVRDIIFQKNKFKNSIEAIEYLNNQSS